VEAFGFSLAESLRFPAVSALVHVPSGRDGRGPQPRRRIIMTKTTKSAATKAPSHYAYHVRDREGGKGFWTRIGAAWTHDDGNGLNIQIDVAPLDGRITLRVPSEKED
jgi:hypothetical protein